MPFYLESSAKVVGKIRYFGGGDAFRSVESDVNSCNLHTAREGRDSVTFIC